jgi:three-Cys-motif partner protein
LGALSFELFRILTDLNHIDIIVHISIADLQRNVDLYASDDYDQFDTFAPGWRSAVNFKAMNKTTLRSAILNYWSDQVARLGLTKAKHSELIKGPGNQRLYWLCLLSRDRLAHKLWDAISSAAKRPVMF